MGGGELRDRRVITDLLQAKTEKAEALQKKRDEAERKARRGEIDPTHEFTFLLVGQVSQQAGESELHLSYFPSDLRSRSP